MRGTLRAGNGVWLGAAASLLLLLSSCSNGPKTVELTDAIRRPRLVLRLQAGPKYRKPQMAVWIETLDGTYVRTVYVTAKAARGSWLLAPKGGRPEALPVWDHARKARAVEDVEAVARATPAGSSDLGCPGSEALSEGRYAVYAEINRSFDYNESYPKARGVGGQPSIVYKAAITVGPKADETVLEPLGTGSPDGSDGEIHEGLEGITTASRIFSSLGVRYEVD